MYSVHPVTLMTNTGLWQEALEVLLTKSVEIIVKVTFAKGIEILEKLILTSLTLLADNASSAFFVMKLLTHSDT